MARTVLWDMDGTIADSEEAHFLAWKTSLSRYGVIYSFDDFIADFGRSNRQLLPKVLGVEAGDSLIDQVSHEKEASFRVICRERHVRPLPGVVAWLEKFQAAGVQQVVSSSGPMANIVTLTDILDIGDFFLSLMSGATLPRSKPDPAIFLHSAAAVQAHPSECIVIEDSLHGIEGAVRAGMGGIAVGKIAGRAELNAVADDGRSAHVIALQRLDELTWADCELLWR